jgi:hypothetical protein
MDLYCGHCGEPTDNDTLHDEVDDGQYANYAEAAAAFRSKGCEAVSWLVHNPETMNSKRAAVADAMFDLLGDDLDGASAMMEDFEYLGML